MVIIGKYIVMAEALNTKINSKRAVITNKTKM